MTMVDVAPTYWPQSPASTSPGFSSLLLDASDEVYAGIVRIKKAGTINRVHFRTATVTNGATVNVRLETVDASGDPSDTLFAANTETTHVIANGDDNTWIRTGTLTASATVAIGDLIAVVIENPTASPGNLNIVYSTSAGFTASPGNPGVFGPVRTTSVDLAFPLVALEYDDGTFAIPMGAIPIDTASTVVTVDTARNPDEVALYFTPQFKVRIVGWWATLALVATADFRASLYASGNNTPLMTTDYDGDFISNTGSRNVSEFFNDSPVTLDAGTAYYLGFQGLSTTDVSLRYWEVNSSYLNLLDCLPGKQAMHYASRDRSSTTDPDAAAWTPITNRRLQAGLIYDQIDDGAGTGGGSASPGSLGGGIHQ
jgi:hypothetical protein